MSEETNAFTADVYVDGKKAGYAKNRGHGDPIQVDWTDYEFGRTVEAWAKALPPIESEWGPVKNDIEIIIGDIVEKDRYTKHLNRLRNSLLRRYNKGELIYRVKGESPGAYTHWRGATEERVKARHGEVEFYDPQDPDKFLKALGHIKDEVVA